MARDAAGRRLVNVDALAAISESANVPTYGVAASYIGAGIVGGVVSNQRVISEKAAELAVRLLRGARVEDVPVVDVPLTPMVDWRQLRRWRIPEARLPRGTVVLHKEPSLWDAYRWHIAGVITLCVVQGFLIGALLLQRAESRRANEELRRTEAVAQEQRLELAHLGRVATLGELSGAMAHELRQPLTAILANAQAARRFLKADPLDRDQLQEITDGIVEADRRAVEIIEGMRSMLRRGEVKSQLLDLNELAQEVLTLAASDLRRRGVTVVTRLDPRLPGVSGDRVQLQQVLLNLVLNGCDAMSAVPGDERRLTVATGPGGDGMVQLTVEDCGTGIPSSELDRIFEPFHTAKADGLGLGLTICRTIVSAHGGRLWATNNPERGATIHLALPDAGTLPSP
jgi:signal transduction histidine kinase